MEQAVFAVNHKKDSLSNLGRMMAMEYFATPTEPKDLSREQKETIQENRKETQRQDKAQRYHERSSGRTRRK